MLALLGALSEELITLRKSLAVEESLRWGDSHIYRGRYGDKEVLLVQTGVGREKAEAAANFILEHYPVTTLLSLGFAGALTEELKVGDVFLCSTLYRESPSGETPVETPYYSDAHLLSLALPAVEGIKARFYQGSSVTVDKPVSTGEAKRALGRASCAEVVDMESYWIARIASARQVPFLAIRTISDALTDSLLSSAQILNPDGTWQLKGVALYLISHPHHLMRLLALYRHARQARKNLTNFVESFLAKL